MRRHPLFAIAFVVLISSFILTVWNDAGPAEELNLPPTADAGQDTTVECAGTIFTQFKTLVMLDGTGSFDPDGDPLTYYWTAPGVGFDDPASPTPTGGFPFGTTTVTLTVSDGLLDDVVTVDVAVEDTTPPQIAVSLNRDVLWPPNHMMANIFVAIVVNQDCCGTTPSVVLDSIWSSEPDNDKGDGDTVDDIQGAVVGNRDNAFSLRSERKGDGEGRVYTMIYKATDCAGNVGSDTVEVRVPHDQMGGKAVPTLGFSPDGLALDPTAGQFVLVVLSEPEKYKKDKKKNLVLVYEGVDATALDLDRTYVGNVKGVLTPQRAEEIDIDADGLDDLALYFSARELNLLIGDCTGSTPDIQWEAYYGPIGLHYTSEANLDYLVPDIFELGEPVTLEAGSAADAPSQTATGRVAAGATVCSLFPNYPNPFNPSTTIAFALSERSRATLAIYDVSGRLVRSLVNDILERGYKEYQWHGRDAHGNPVSSGVYFYRLTAGNRTLTKKMVLLK